MTEAADLERLHGKSKEVRFFAEGDMKTRPQSQFETTGKGATERLLKFLRAWK